MSKTLPSIGGTKPLGRARLLPSLVCFAALALTGCAGWKGNVQSPTLTAKREDRTAEAVRDFEGRRDAAQLAAALDRWKQGEAARAEAMLAAIVNRRPDYADARLRLAEILWSRNDAGAEHHLRAVLQTQPDRAEAHHALALALYGTGRSDEAHQHLTKATELEPANEVYRQTIDSLAFR